MTLQEKIQKLAEHPPDKFGDEHYELFAEFKRQLNSGVARAAEKIDGRWQVNHWVKHGILLGFKLGHIENLSVGYTPFFDKHTFPLKGISIGDGVRIVPGGSSIRDGCYIGRGVTCMPPMFVNAGAYVDDNTMIDSHALVGSCAQIGKRVHISAAAQIGGVLEPVGSVPVVIEDDVVIGGNSGVYEGAIIRSRVVIGAGVVITGSTPVYDLVKETIYRRKDGQPLEIPSGAVVVPGSRPMRGAFSERNGLQVAAP